MTSIALTKTEHGTTVVLVNGRKHFTSRIASLTQESAGKWVGETINGWAFVLIGGKASGGASNEWFVSCLGEDYLPAKSAAECIRIILSY